MTERHSTMVQRTTLVSSNLKWSKKKIKKELSLDYDEDNIQWFIHNDFGKLKEQEGTAADTLGWG